MPEISLGYTIQDYLSGKGIEATTYEDFRQAIVQMLVERKGFPASNIKSKVCISIQIQGRDYNSCVDLAIYDDLNNALMIVQFCAGVVQTYLRQTLASARLLPDNPAKLALVTDTKQAILLKVVDGSILEDKGYYSIPTWREILDLAEDMPQYELTPQKKAIEERILYAYSELGCSTCSETECNS